MQRVLVVEDEVLVGVLMEDMLRELGCEVAALSTHLDQALRLVESSSFDFAVLDININGDRSFPVADILARRGVPFLFATGYGAKSLPDRHVGVIILHKPFGLDELQAALARLLSPSPQTRNCHEHWFPNLRVNAIGCACATLPGPELVSCPLPGVKQT
jgi:CheY-like chemotaxis protein